MKDKTTLRKEMRATRKATVAALPDAVRSLVFSRPPAPILDHIADDSVIGLYRASANEAPAARYAQFFLEAGHRIALPRLLAEEGAMRFAEHTDPLGESDLVEGPHGILQPGKDAEDVLPDVLFVPLLAFDETGRRLGQGGGYYDRWIADHPEVLRIGLAWDTQAVDEVPSEPHDMDLRLVITPTRVYGGEA